MPGSRNGPMWPSSWWVFKKNTPHLRDRRQRAEVVSVLQSLPAGVSKSAACRALEVPRHWCYPDRRRRYQRKPEPAVGRGLSPAEDQALLDHLHSKRFQDAAPRQVHATLLSEGEVIASVSTMYRRLSVRRESCERRNQRPAQHHVKPQLEATAPNQIVTW